MANWGDRESPSLGGELSGGVRGAPRDPAADFDFPALVAIADTLPVMIAYCDPDQRYLFVNQPIADWFELPRSEILGRTVSEVMGDAAYALRRGAIERALKGTEQVVSAEFVHPNRGKLYTRATYRPHRDEDGRVVGLVMVVEDITDHRTALANRDARFRAIFDSIDMVGLTDLEGKLIDVNQSALDTMGVRLEQVVGNSVLDVPFIVDIPESQMALGALVKRAAGGLGGSIEIDVRQGGKPGVHMVSVKPVTGGDGKPDFLVVEGRDLSELKVAQDQLRQAQKMEALGQLTGGIAHDFNNLLTVVVGGLDMINRRIEDEKTRSYAANALAAAERGARLTGQLLAFSRVQKLEVRPTDVGALIEHAQPLLRHVLGPGIDKRIEIDPGVGPAFADPTQLETALLNLAVNARDAMPGGGCLTTHLSERRISGDGELEDGDYVQLAVTDTGTGMPEEVRLRVFDPFFTTKEVGKGTGLGLSMVYGMARQSGGVARIESREGEGTTVCVLLRCAPSEELQRSSSDERLAGPSPDVGQKVLVVDDDDAVRAFMVETLRDHGFEVAEAADGPKALALYAETNPDLVVLDYIMPGLSGADVARSILGERPDQPILFVSGYSETDAIRAVAPDARLLAKPFRGDALMEALGDLAAND